MLGLGWDPESHFVVPQKCFVNNVNLFVAHPEHAHGGAGDALRDLSEEGEEQVVSAEAPRHSSRRPAKEVGRQCPSCFAAAAKFETEKKRVGVA